jgi:hypothetical protein
VGGTPRARVPAAVATSRALVGDAAPVRRLDPAHDRGRTIWRTGRTGAGWMALALALLLFAGEELLARRVRTA